MSQESAQQENSRMRISRGKIFKGTMNDAPMKVKVSSIPAKHENIVYDNHKRAAFGNSRDRFYQSHYSSTQPGPGMYTQSQQKQGEKIYSKKGYGSLISKTKLNRMEPSYSRLPGPGSYDCSKTGLESRMRRTQSVAQMSSKLQNHQLFNEEIQRSKDIPAPNNYNVRIRRSFSQSHKFARSPSRFQSSITGDAPPVGTYNYQGTAISSKIKEKIHYNKTAFTLFEEAKEKKLKIVRELLNGSKKLSFMEKPDETVGPGSYNSKPIETRIGFKIHKTNNDRFGQVINKASKKSSLQGSPLFEGRSHDSRLDSYGSKNVETFKANDFESDQRKIARTSMFKSKDSRYDFVKEHINDPGRYSPTKNERKSHLINFSSKWV